MKSVYTFITCIAVLISSLPILAESKKNSDSGFSNAVILVIRHAEKPDNGIGLSPAGYKRAEEYVSYFENYMVNDKPVHIDALYAAKDSKSSIRPRLTITPLSQALNLPVNMPYDEDESQKLAKLLQSNSADKTILICWHHGQIPDLLKALGADPKQLLPEGQWPGKEFGWVIQLCYDKHGQLEPDCTKRIDENL